jgi:hypothetical protein
MRSIAEERRKNVSWFLIQDVTHIPLFSAIVPIHLAEIGSEERDR